MYDIAVNQLHRRHFAIGKGGGFMDIEKGVADAGDIAQQAGCKRHDARKNQWMMI
jgi:hypothetical protein